MIAKDQILSSAFEHISAPTPACVPESEDADVLDLTSRLAKGDEDGFRQLHLRYFDRLLRYLIVVLRGDEDAAREALQDTFCRVVRHAKVLRNEKVFWSWLTVLARCAAIDGQRKRSRYWRVLQIFSFSRRADDVEAYSPGEADERLLALLNEMLPSLPESERALLESKYLRGESVEEMARSRGETEKAVESRLVRVRRRLKESILKRIKNEEREP